MVTFNTTDTVKTVRFDAYDDPLSLNAHLAVDPDLPVEVNPDTARIEVSLKAKKQRELLEIESKLEPVLMLFDTLSPGLETEEKLAALLNFLNNIPTCSNEPDKTTETEHTNKTSGQFFVAK